MSTRPRRNAGAHTTTSLSPSAGTPPGTPPAGSRRDLQIVPLEGPRMGAAQQRSPRPGAAASPRSGVTAPVVFSDGFTLQPSPEGGSASAPLPSGGRESEIQAAADAASAPLAGVAGARLPLGMRGSRQVGVSGSFASEVTLASYCVQGGAPEGAAASQRRAPSQLLSFDRAAPLAELEAQQQQLGVPEPVQLGDTVVLHRSASGRSPAGSSRRYDDAALSSSLGELPAGGQVTPPHRPSPPPSPLSTSKRAAAQAKLAQMLQVGSAPPRPRAPCSGARCSPRRAGHRPCPLAPPSSSPLPSAPRCSARAWTPPWRPPPTTFWPP